MKRRFQAFIESRWVHFIGLWIILSALVIFWLAFAHTYALRSDGRCFQSLWHAQWPKWIGCAMARHEDLAGGLLGFAGALLAAWVAYIAIERQISAAREESRRPEKAAEEALVAASTELFASLNLLWRSVDVALRPGQAEDLRQPNMSLVHSMLQTLPRAEILDALGKMSQALEPEKQWRFAFVIDAIQNIYKWNEQKSSDLVGPAAPDRYQTQRHVVLALRILLSHVRQYAENFDSTLSSVFNGRTVTPVDHRPFAAHMEASIETAEGGGNWLN